MRPISLPAGQRWDARSFPMRIAEMRSEMIQRVQQRLNADGAVRDPCASRILESALAIRLMEAAGGFSVPLARARTFLAEQQGAAGSFDQAFAAAGRDVTNNSDFVNEVVSKVPDFLARRKRAQVEAYGLILGYRLEIVWDPGLFTLDGLHSWAQVQVIAAKVITAHAADRIELISDEDVRLLLEAQQTADVWEGIVLIHLIVLHALRRLPNTHHTVQVGIAKLLKHQRPDGGFPFVIDTDIWSTATAGIALWSAGAPVGMLTRISGHLARKQLPGGGWSYSGAAHQTDVDDTSVAVQFLHALNPTTYHPIIARGIQSIKAVARPDGGFPTYVSHGPSEACMTAACADALSIHGRRNAKLISRALTFLTTQQDVDGSFPVSWSISQLHGIFRILLAVRRNAEIADWRVLCMADRAMSYVLRAQNDDGGWGLEPGKPSAVVSTAYGLICACYQEDPAPARRATAYLLDACRDRAHIISPPDTIGPRPFVFAVPVLADIFSLLAVGHLMRRLDSTGIEAFPDIRRHTDIGR